MIFCFLPALLPDSRSAIYGIPFSLFACKKINLFDQWLCFAVCVWVLHARAESRDQVSCEEGPIPDSLSNGSRRARGPSVCWACWRVIWGPSIQAEAACLSFCFSLFFSTNGGGIQSAATQVDQIPVFNKKGTQYFVDLKMGSPPQPFTVIFDTG